MSNPSKHPKKLTPPISHIPRTPAELPSSSFITPAKTKSTFEKQSRMTHEDQPETHTESTLQPVTEESEDESKHDNENNSEQTPTHTQNPSHIDNTSSIHDEIQRQFDLKMIQMEQQMNQMKHQLEQTQTQNAWLQYQQRMQFHPPQGQSPTHDSNFIKNVGKPEHFTGDYKSNPETWLTTMYEFMLLTNIPHHLFVSFAVTYLREQARVWWSSLTNEVRIENQYWDAFTKLLLRKYRPVDQSRTSRIQLQTLKQISSVSSYNNVFSTIMQNIHDMSTADQLHHYLHGLKENIQIRLVTEEFDDVHTAMNAAARVDSLLYRKNPIVNTNHYNNGRRNNFGTGTSVAMAVNNIDVDVEPQENEMNEESEIVGVNAAYVRFTKLTDEQRAQCRREGRCFKCRNKGHMANTCPTSTNRNGAPAFSSNMNMKPSAPISNTKKY
jgi:hypothetical protein